MLSSDYALINASSIITLTRPVVTLSFFYIKKKKNRFLIIYSFISNPVYINISTRIDGNIVKHAREYCFYLKYEF